MIYVRVLFKESTHDRALSVWGACLAPTGAERRGASRVYNTGLTEYIGRKVAPMTAYEIISIFIGILALLSLNNTRKAGKP